ncbi:MAG: branched-chain amino acid ABC transporter ATP-binding protein/permease [Solirubrobacterales bacterium]
MLSLALVAIALFVIPTWPPRLIGESNAFLLSVACQAAIFAIVAVATNMFVEQTGLPSVAQAGFWGIGAYSAGIAASQMGIGFWPSLLVAAAIPALFALPVGWVILRASGIAFLVVTLAFSGFMVVVFNNLGVTGGSSGLTISKVPGAIGPIEFTSARDLYYLFLAFLALTVLVYWLVARSSFGLRLRAIRDNEPLARSLGLSALWNRIVLLMLSGAIVGVAGALLLYQQQAVTPKLFEGLAFIDIYLAIVLGGTALLAGPAVGAWIVLFLPVWLGSSDPNTSRLIYGILLVLSILVLPRGLLGSFKAWAYGESKGFWGLRRREAAPAPEVPIEDAAPAPLRGSDEAPAAPERPPLDPAAPVVLGVNGLKRWFGANRALDGVDFELRRGEIRGVIGPNGSGKTTLLNCVSGFMPTTDGEVWFDGGRIDGMQPDAIARKGIVRTFQQPESFSSFDVATSCGLVLESAERHRGGKAAATRGVEEILAACHLAEVAELPVEELSYGQLRLLGVALALCRGPAVMMLDEPAAGLTAADSAILRETIMRARDGGVTVVVVDHDMSFMLSMCDKLTVLDSGLKLAEGDPETVSSDEAVVAAYLGESFAKRHSPGRDATGEPA